MDLYEEIVFQTTTETISELGEQKIKDKARIRYLATPCRSRDSNVFIFSNWKYWKKIVGLGLRKKTSFYIRSYENNF